MYAFIQISLFSLDLLWSVSSAIFLVIFLFMCVIELLVCEPISYHILQACLVESISQMDLDITHGYNLQDIHMYIFIFTYIFFYSRILSQFPRCWRHSLTRRWCIYRKSLHTEQLYNLWITRKLLSRKSYPNRGKPRRSVLVSFA